MLPAATNSEVDEDSRSGPLTGRHLRAARVLAGLMQTELAVASGLHPNSIRYWERQMAIGEREIGAVPELLAALRRHGVDLSVTDSDDVIIIRRRAPSRT